jgi:serine protease Do
MKAFTKFSVPAIALAVMIAGVQAATPPTVRDLGRMSGELETLSATLGPKVVQVSTQGLKVTEGGEDQPAGVLVAEHGRGSGFFVAPDGYVMTNAHVIANATRIVVTVQGAQGPKEYAAAVTGVDSDNDLAILKIDATGLAYFDVNAPASARQGQLVLAYGSPLGLAQSASLGLVSAVNRQLSADDPRTYLQTDASMNPGNSGGPLVDLEGRLLGINTMILSQSGGSEGIGFAVPLDVIRGSYAALRAKGTRIRPLLGIQPRSLSADLITGLGLKTKQGVLVEDVNPAGSAGIAGIEPGDVLVSLNAQAIKSVSDLYRVEYELPAGAPVDVAVMHGADLRLLSIIPEAGRQNSAALAPGSVTEKDNLIFRLGVYGGTVNAAVANAIGGLREAQGVVVLARTGTSLAGQSALSAGDIVHAVNGAKVDSVESLRKALETAGDTAPIVLQIERGGMYSFQTLGTSQGPETTRTKKTSRGRTPADAGLKF